MSDRQSRRTTEDIPDEGASAQPCSFCMDTPTGATGHEGLALEIRKLPAELRALICISCFFCGTRWARTRLSAKDFAWHRVIG